MFQERVFSQMLRNYVFVAGFFPSVKVYTMSINSWRKRIGDMFPGRILHYYSQMGPSPFVNGVLHWMACRGREMEELVIMSFQLADEIFGEIIVPSFDGHCTAILAVQHSIALVVQDPATTKWDKWVMKEYGVVNSWAKQYSLRNTIGFPSGSMKNGEIPIERRTGNLVSYDPKTQFHRDLKLP
ncbi:unnamed protein product [Camellia sinensis]